MTIQAIDTVDRVMDAQNGETYTSWLRKEVQEAINDTRPSVPHSEVVADWVIERANLLEQINPTGC
jgi:hypothetical protein